MKQKKVKTEGLTGQQIKDVMNLLHAANVNQRRKLTAYLLSAVELEDETLTRIH